MRWRDMARLRAGGTDSRLASETARWRDRTADSPCAHAGVSRVGARRVLEDADRPASDSERREERLAVYAGWDAV